MRFFTKESLSAHQELTPEGFLLCRDVRIARTGTQLYLEAELIGKDGKPLVSGSPEGVVVIERLPEDVFAQETIDSFQAKPVTLQHPSSDVTPENWSSLAKGIVTNVRRGESLDADYLVADLLLTDFDAIKAVRNKDLREVSCGYDANYIQVSPGRGRQMNIIGNHVALVDQGRCGERCAIGDEAMKKPSWFDRALAAFTARDESEMKKALEEGVKDAEAEETEEDKKKREAEEAKKAEDRKTADALANLTARVAKLEDKRAKDEGEETPEEKKAREEKEAEEKKEKTSDSAALLAEVQGVRARAEILSPGLVFPTHDSNADAKKVRDGLCAIKRQALAAAFANPKTRDAVAPLVAGVTLDKLSCDALNTAFIGASEIVRRENNVQAVPSFDGGKQAATVAHSISEINKRNSDFWKRNS